MGAMSSLTAPLLNRASSSCHSTQNRDASAGFSGAARSWNISEFAWRTRKQGKYGRRVGCTEVPPPRSRTSLELIFICQVRFSSEIYRKNMVSILNNFFQTSQSGERSERFRAATDGRQRSRIEPESSPMNEYYNHRVSRH